MTGGGVRIKRFYSLHEQSFCNQNNVVSNTCPLAQDKLKYKFLLGCPFGCPFRQAQ